MAAEKAERFGDAEKDYRAIVEAAPNLARAWHRLALVTARLRAPDEAAPLVRKALDLEPENPIFHESLGAILAELGDMAGAESHIREALRLDPALPDAYYRLSQFKKFQAGDPLGEVMEGLLGDKPLAAENRCLLHFAAGKFYDDIGDHDRAFTHFREANNKSGRLFSRKRHAQHLEEVIATFDENLFDKHARGGNRSETPVFVIGMPRSGTSLVEQILASHPNVHGGGELPDLHAITAALPKYAPAGKSYPACVRSLDEDVIEGFADAYLRRIQSLAPTAQRVTDKSPASVERLGMIALMFPKARFIHCRRDARDTCLSCYFRHFRSHQISYAYDLGNLGYYYRAYERLMGHWAGVLPVDILQVRYEDLVADQERVSRRILDFCGLEWDPACAAFYRNDRPVQTSSLWQVRQPIYTSSVGRWKHYERHLGPLFEALETFGPQR